MYENLTWGGEGGKCWFNHTFLKYFKITMFMCICIYIWNKRQNKQELLWILGKQVFVPPAAFIALCIHHKNLVPCICSCTKIFIWRKTCKWYGMLSARFLISLLSILFMFTFKKMVPTPKRWDWIKTPRNYKASNFLFFFLTVWVSNL